MITPRRTPSAPVSLGMAHFARCAQLHSVFDNARLRVHYIRPTQVRGPYQVLQLDVRCILCHWKSTDPVAQLAPDFPDQDRCEWFADKDRNRDQCHRKKFQPTAKFCFQHLKENYQLCLFYKASMRRSRRPALCTIETPLKSVIEVGPAFKNRESITGLAPDLDLVLNTMEKNTATAAIGNV